jgi:hypothetical protein
MFDARKNFHDVLASVPHLTLADFDPELIDAAKEALSRTGDYCSATHGHTLGTCICGAVTFILEGPE